MLDSILRSRTGILRASTIFRQITRQHTAGELKELRRRSLEKPDQVGEALEKLAEYSVKRGELTASIVPTIVSVDKAWNLKIFTHKPTSDEVRELLYFMVSGILHGDLIINLIDVDRNAFEALCDNLLDHGVIVERGENYQLNGEELRRILSHRGFPLHDNPSCLAFAFLNYLAYFYREMTINEFYRMLGLTDRSATVIFHIPRGSKSSMYVFPKLSSFYQKWYLDYLSGVRRSEYPEFGCFIGSLYVAHPDYRDLSASLLEKSLFYLLNGYVNGELLSKLVSLKATAYLHEKERTGFLYASNFFSKI